MPNTVAPSALKHKHRSGSIEHRVARKLLLDASPDLPPDHASAIVSHWLQRPSEIPVLGDSSLRDHFAHTLRAETGSKSEPRIKFDIPFPPRRNTSFRFIDLFAGIGGFRLALEQAGGTCVFSSEVDSAAQRTYDMNFGEIPFGDIRTFTSPHVTDSELAARIPDHDVLAAGFPCQPFSRAGVSARTSIGQSHGFDDEISGTLFFDIIRIADVKRPSVLFLENVKNLVRHDGGRTFETIRRRVKALGYEFSHQVIDSSRMVPQRRQRTYIIASRLPRAFEFDLGPFLEGHELPLGPFLEDEVSDAYTISDALWAGHQRRTRANLARGVGFTAFTADLSRPANTLVARYGKDGKECLIPQAGKNPRMLTPRECATLQGFPETFALPDARTVAYRQFGNSVSVPVVSELARQIRDHLK